MASNLEVNMSKNNKWSSAAKFEIALQAIKNETTLNDIVVGRREAIAETTKKLTVSEERTMMAGHELPISFARYEDLAPIIGNGYVWWVAAIDTETIVIEVIAGTNRKKQFQAIEQFVRSLRLLKKATTS